MAIKHPIKTTTNTAQPDGPNLPPPQTFEILPPLHELLARVDAHQTQNLPIESAGLPAHDDELAAGPSSGYAELQPLNPKELPTAALEIKGRIRYALRELEKLPDMDRDTAQQEKEILELQQRIGKQKAMLETLSRIAEKTQDRLE